MMNTKVLHDQLLELMPEGAQHDASSCPICQGLETATDNGNPQGGADVSEKTYTEEQVQALVDARVASATEELRTQLDEFKQSQEASEVEARIAAAKSEADEQVAEIQKKLDEAVLKAEQATKERDEILAWLENEKVNQEREAEVARLRDERKARVAEVVEFPESYVAERVEQWASLSEEAFESLLADYKAIAEKAGNGSGNGSELPQVTAMEATRTNENGNGSSPVRDVLGWRRSGIDPRELV